MNKRLFLGVIPFVTTEDELMQMFAQAGAVESVTIVTDKFSGRSKGFAFVEMADEAGAQKAIEMYNETDMQGRNIAVNIARPREERGPSNGGGFRSGGSRGGFGGGNRGGAAGGSWGGRNDSRGPSRGGW